MPSIRDHYRSSVEYRTARRAGRGGLRAIRRAFRDNAEPGARVVDVGCGVGASTRLLRKAGFDAVGADVSERFLPAGEDGFVVADFQSAPQIPVGAYAAAAR